MAGTRELILKFLGDSKGLKQATDEADKAVAGHDSKLKELATTVAAAYATKKIIDFAKDSVQAALDDEASQTTLQQALRNTVGATDEVIAKQEEFIGKMADATGVADDVLRPAFARLVTSTRDVGEAQDLMRLAMDVSKGTGKDLQAVVEALGKAHDGNVGALSRLGLQTKDAEGKTLTFDAAVQGLSETFKGQAAAAAETNAGKIAIMKERYGELQETVGTALLPVLSQLAGIASELIGWFNGLDKGTQEWIARIAILGGGVLAASKAITGISNIAKSFNTVSGLLTKALAANTTASGLFTAALVAGTVALIAYNLQQKHDREEAEKLSKAFTELSRASDTNALEAWNNILAHSGDIIGSVDKLNREFAQGNIEGAKRVLALAEANGENDDRTRSLKKAIEDEEAAARQGKETTKQYGETTQDAGEKIEDATSITDKYRGMVDGATTSLGYVNIALLDQQAAAQKAWRATWDLAQAQKASKDLADEQTAAWGALTGSLNTTEAFLNLKDQFDKTKQAATDAWTAATEGADDAEQKSRDYQKELINQKQGVIEYGKSIGLLPSEVKTLLTLLDNGQIDDVNRRLDIATRNRTMTLSILAKGGDIKVTTPNGQVVGAEGGIINRPTLVLAGEAGRSEALIPLDQTAGNSALPSGLFGGGTTIVNNNFYGTVMGEQDLVRMVFDKILDGQKRGELVGSLG